MSIDHDELVDLGRRAVGKLTVTEAADAFVAGLGSWPRGQTVLMAFALCRHLPDHSYVAFAGPANPVQYDHHPVRSPVCAVCAAPAVYPYDPEETREALDRGGWNHDNVLSTAVLDLDHLVGVEPPGPTSTDVGVLEAVLDVLDGASDDTPPSGAAKLLASAKVLPRQKGGGRADVRRDVVLMTLALVGVLPQHSVPSKLDRWYDAGEEVEAWTALGRSYRSDLMLPLAGWTGADGVDRERVRELFGHLL